MRSTLGKHAMVKIDRSNYFFLGAILDAQFSEQICPLQNRCCPSLNQSQGEVFRNGDTICTRKLDRMSTSKCWRLQRSPLTAQQWNDSHLLNFLLSHFDLSIFEGQEEQSCAGCMPFIIWCERSHLRMRAPQVCL